MFTRNMQFLFINISLVLIFVFSKSISFSLLELINVTFYFALIYMVITLLIYTIQGGFYDGLTFGLRRFRHVISKRGDPLDEWEKKPPLSEKINQKFYQVVCFQFLALSIILIISLMIYYSMK